MPAPVVRRSPAHRGRVLANVGISRRMRRVTVAADTMRGVALKPAQDVELLLREESGRRVKRRYTIRHGRPETGELDLDVLLHGDGPGSTWGATAAPGDEIEFQGPRGKLELRPAPFHLLVGDESAVPAIASITEVLTEPSLAVLETGDDELPVPGARWIHRGDHPPGTPDLLGAALTDVELPPGLHAYLLGETRAMVALRALLEARGVAHDAIFVKGYWNLGRVGRPPGQPGQPPNVSAAGNPPAGME